MRKAVFVAILAMGFSGLIAQILLLREFLIVFAGNEFAIGIVLANWLILEAFGSFYLGRQIERIHRKREAYVGVTILFCLSLLVAVFLIRLLKRLIGVSIGESIGLWPMFYSSFLLLLPVSALHGALFTFSCELYALSSRRDATAAGRVYVYETIGTVVGGIVCTYLLIPYVDTFQASAGLATLNLVACLFLLVSGQMPMPPPAPSQMKTGGRMPSAPTTGAFSGQMSMPNAAPRRMKIPAGLEPSGGSRRCRADRLKPRVQVGWRRFSGQSNDTSWKSMTVLVAVLTVSSLFLTSQAHKLHRFSVAEQWRGQNVVHYQNSVYGNICVVHNEGQYIFFQDGVATVITPVPDIPFVEQFVHLPLLAHPDPRRLLILSGGAGGVINEALKHPSVEVIEYAELDPLLIDLFWKFPTPLTAAELTDPRVAIQHIDGRLLVKTTPHRYDVILVGIMEPSSLQTNRFFTAEFFALARERLNDSGILVMGLPGSLTYQSPELRDLNGSIWHTLQRVFPHVRVIPGDGVNLLLASEAADVATLDALQVARRLYQRDIAARVVLPWYIEQKLHRGWQEWFAAYIQGGSREINTDFRPIGVFYTIAHWNAVFAPSLRGVFAQLGRLSLLPIGVLVGVLLLLWFVARARSLRPLRPGIPLAIATTGFAGMAFDLTLTFAFQAIYGYVFAWIGLLAASFMAGAACGALLITAALKRIADGFGYFRATELAIMGFAVGCPLLILAANTRLGDVNLFVVYRWLFLILAFVGGLLTGAQFPLANRMRLQTENTTLSETAGVLYAADLLGGWLGGMVGAVVLLPVLGLVGTCVTVVLLKLMSLIVVITEPR